MAGKTDFVHKIKFNVTLNNLDKFEDYDTETFSVGGNPWLLSFEKIKMNDKDVNAHDHLAIFLVSKVENDANDWAIVADFKAKVVSNNLRIDPQKYSLNNVVYESNSMSWGGNIVFSWEVLMDPGKGYVQENTCKITIEVKASPLQNKANNQLLEFVPIKKCCDGSLKGKFRIKINHIHQFNNVCSPEFVLGNFPWRFLITKSPEKFLRVVLYNPILTKETEKSCKITLTCNLIVNNPDDDDLLKLMENEKFEYEEFENYLDMISWKDLVNPDKKFIHENNSIVLKMKLKITETNVEKVARGLKPKDNDDDAVQLECPVCLASLVGQPSFVLLNCGHIFCKKCADEAQQNRMCASCKAACNNLQKVFLPYRNK